MSIILQWRYISTKKSVYIELPLLIFCIYSIPEALVFSNRVSQHSVNGSVKSASGWDLNLNTRSSSDLYLVLKKDSLQGMTTFWIQGDNIVLSSSQPTTLNKIQPHWLPAQLSQGLRSSFHICSSYMYHINTPPYHETPMFSQLSHSNVVIHDNYTHT